MRNGFKKRICLILAAMMIAMNVMPALAEEIPGDVFEEELSEVLPDGVIGVAPEGAGMAKVIQTAEKDFYPAESIQICGLTVKKGEYIYATPSEEDSDYIVLEVSSKHPVDEGGDELESEYAQYCKDGTLKLYDFNPGEMGEFEDEDGDVFHNGIISEGDLIIHLSGANEINMSSTEKPAIGCKSLTLSGEDDAASLGVFMGMDNEDPVEAIYCEKDFYIQSNCIVDIGNYSEGPGIRCRNFVMEECEEVYLTIETSADGIICDKFTLIPNGVACIEITAGDDGDYKIAGIRSKDIEINCPNVPSYDNVIIRAAGVGIWSESDVVIKSGNLTIGASASAGPGGGSSGSDVGIGIKAGKQILLGTKEDKKTEAPELFIAINTYEGGIEAGEVEIDSGAIEINAPDGKTEPEINNVNGIVADKITINGGDVTVYSTESALVLSDDTQKIIIAEDLSIKAGSPDDLKFVDEYSGEEAVEIIDYCNHKDVVMIEGKKPTLFEDGWKDYYKCNDCGWLYEDRECTVRIAYLKGWKNGKGKLPKIEPEPEPDPDPDPKPVPRPSSSGYTAPVIKPVTTGSMDTPVKDGTWKKLENGKWTFATNAPFKDTWGCIEYTKSNGEKTKGWFRFDKEGNMLVGYQEIDGKKYYFCEQEGDIYGMCQLGGTAPNGQKINEYGSLVE